MTESTLIYIGSPRLILETSKSNFYSVIDRIILSDKKSKILRIESTEELCLDIDIFEIPTRSLEICFRTKAPEQVCISMYQEIKKLALLSNSDYFSNENIGSQAAIHLTSENGLEVYKAIPRLFRKIH